MRCVYCHKILHVPYYGTMGRDTENRNSIYCLSSPTSYHAVSK